MKLKRFVVNGSTYYYVRNVQGDIIKILDGNMEEVVEYKYDTWGNVIGMEGSDYGKWVGSLNPFRYRGYYYDDESGLYYIQSRYYNPEWGRFMNLDGIIFDDNFYRNLNLYHYCKNNPVGNYDIAGNWVMSVGISANATAVIGISSSVAIVWDDNGNIGIQTTNGGLTLVEQWEETEYFGLLDAGVGLTYSWVPTADTIFDMEGYAYQIGGSAGSGLPYIGIDAIRLGEDTTNPLALDGAQVSLGVGVGVDAHVSKTYTDKTIILVEGNKNSSSSSTNKPKYVGEAKGGQGTKGCGGVWYY